jgi:hypothetical protein
MNLPDAPIAHTEPLDNHGHEWRCYMRDPDGYLRSAITLNRLSTTSKNTLLELPAGSPSLATSRFHLIRSAGGLVLTVEHLRVSLAVWVEAILLSSFPGGY